VPHTGAALIPVSEVVPVHRYEVPPWLTPWPWCGSAP